MVVNTFQKRTVFIVLLLFMANQLIAGNNENGSKLWFANHKLPAEYTISQFTSVVVSKNSPTFQHIQKNISAESDKPVRKPKELNQLKFDMKHHY